MEIRERLIDTFQGITGINESEYLKRICDKNVDASLSQLLSEKPVSLEDLNQSIEENFYTISKCFENGQLEIFRSIYLPVVAFYLVNYEKYLRDRWPLSNEDLKRLYQFMGCSYGNY